ncbi:MotE family protein [Thalassovita taeanensis]|uniref:Magnesium transporter MgtE intracellular domain-containing protein n=1 Tax=Thalassovita taeanensis TaxID=657014 RepID=A0A1H9CJE7_9RHOB|nr:hypothetical protein [Thalassovita taeanensis]SEQ01325.1 hypothetical protein SAMN04488092_103282 [Thalassovita taeanensis]
MSKRLKTRSRRPGKGALSLIACLLLGSALIRLGMGAGQALAKADPAPHTPTAAPVVQETCETPEDYRAMIEAFQVRKIRLDRQETQMRDRMQALAIADREIETRMSALQQAEENLRATLALADQAAEGDITRLVAVYETMKPKDAAALFEEMDPDFAAGFLARMAPEAAAGVMAGLSPQSAYTISVVLAGRNANVPKE